MAKASDCSVTPMAERWRSPRLAETFLLDVTGRMQRAAMILFFSIIKAPSCKGLFLKKMFSIKALETIASKRSPVATVPGRRLSWVSTIKAPVFSWLMWTQACTT